MRKLWIEDANNSIRRQKRTANYNGYFCQTVDICLGGGKWQGYCIDWHIFLTALAYFLWVNHQVAFIHLLRTCKADIGESYIREKHTVHAEL